MLGTPKLCGPVNEWTQILRIEGCIPGAVIEILAETGTEKELVAKQRSAGGSDDVPLMDGVALKAGWILRARQVGGSESPWTPDALAVRVDRAPRDHADLLTPRFKSRLFPCSRAVCRVNLNARDDGVSSRCASGEWRSEITVGA